jgi:hypothetical protein
VSWDRWRRCSPDSKRVSAFQRKHIAGRAGNDWDTSIYFVDQHDQIVGFWGDSCGTIRDSWCEWLNGYLQLCPLSMLSAWTHQDWLKIRLWYPTSVGVSLAPSNHPFVRDGQPIPSFVQQLFILQMWSHVLETWTANALSWYPTRKSNSFSII